MTGPVFVCVRSALTALIISKVCHAAPAAIVWPYPAVALRHATATATHPSHLKRSCLDLYKRWLRWQHGDVFAKYEQQALTNGTTGTKKPKVFFQFFFL